VAHRNLIGKEINQNREKEKSLGSGVSWGTRRHIASPQVAAMGVKTRAQMLNKPKPLSRNLLPSRSGKVRNGIDLLRNPRS